MAHATSTHPYMRKHDRHDSRATLSPTLLRSRGCSGNAIGRHETIATYDRLAVEYDLATHETTRGLEMASLQGLAVALTLVSERARTLELGCGTGVATGLLSASAGVARIVATDPPRRMRATAGAK